MYEHHKLDEDDDGMPRRLVPTPVLSSSSSSNNGGIINTRVASKNKSSVPRPSQGTVPPDVVEYDSDLVANIAQSELLSSGFKACMKSLSNTMRSSNTAALLQRIVDEVIGMLTKHQNQCDAKSKDVDRLKSLLRQSERSNEELAHRNQSLLEAATSKIDNDPRRDHKKRRGNDDDDGENERGLREQVATLARERDALRRSLLAERGANDARDDNDDDDADAESRRRRSRSLREARDENATLSSLLESQRTECAALRSDGRAASEEARTTTEENQRLRSGLARTTTELSAARESAHERDSALRATLSERDDLAASYRRLAEEKRAVDHGAQEIERERRRLANECARLQQDFDHVRAHNERVERSLETRQRDCDAYERRTDETVREFQALLRKYEAAEAENAAIRTDLVSSKRNVEEISRRMCDLQRRQARAEADVNFQRETTRAADGEREALQTLLGNERDRGRALERLLEEMRVKDIATGDEIGRLAKENAELLTQLNELRTRETLLNETIARHEADAKKQSHNNAPVSSLASYLVQNNGT